MTAVAALGDLAEFIRGVTFKPEQVSTSDDVEAVACLRTKNVQAQLETSDLVFVPRSVVKNEAQMVRHGDIVISSANSWNLVGKSSWVGDLDFEAAIGGFICLLRVTRDDVDARYLFRWFSSPRIQAIVRSFGQKTTNISNLNLGRARELEVPLPPLPEQRRIAAILDQVDELRTKRRRALTLLDELADSLFIDMFGDLVKSDHGWPTGEVRDLVAGFSSGRSLASMTEGTPESLRVLKVSAVTKGIFNPNESKPLPLEYEPPDGHFVRKGDLLFSRANTSDLIGATAYVRDHWPNLVLSDKLWRFLWAPGAQSSALYVWSAFSRREFRRQISERATGSSGSMKNISQGVVLSLPLVIPPASLREEYGEKLLKIEDARVSTNSSLVKLDELFASLQHRAFRGKL